MRRCEYPSWHNAVAGGVAGAGSRIATAPLDLLRIRRQLSYPSQSLWQSWKTIVATEGGIRALFRGNLAAIYLWVGYAAVQFSCYGHFKDWLGEWGSKTTKTFVCGAGAGLCATMATYPFDVCRTTFAARGVTTVSPISSMAEPSYEARPPTSMREFVVQLYRVHGVRGFYAGAAPAALQILPYMGMSFALYEALTSESIGSAAYAGSIAGAVSKMVVYPMDTVKRRLQAQSFYRQTRHYQGTWDCIRQIATREGWRSFYRGMLPSVMKTTIASGLSFSLFRLSKDGLETMHNWMAEDYD